MVDDEPLFLRSLSRILARYGWACRKAATPLVALQLLGAGAFDVMVADYRMHPYDGIELCRRARCAGFDLPIAIYSGHASVAVHERAVRAGASAVVPKHVGAEALAAQLATVSDHFTHLRAGATPAAHSTHPDRQALAQAYSRAHRLSERQRQVLLCALHDATREQAAERIGCRVGTVHEHWRRICARTNQADQKEVLLDVLRFALRTDLDVPDSEC